MFRLLPPIALMLALVTGPALGQDVPNQGSGGGSTGPEAMMPDPHPDDSSDFNVTFGAPENFTGSLEGPVAGDQDTPWQGNTDDLNQNCVDRGAGRMCD